jgi:hypothetical protein
MLCGGVMAELSEARFTTFDLVLYGVAPLE